MRSFFKTVAAFLLFSCSAAESAQYWVATNGNNSNPGTQASPWLTVSNAARMVRSNDFVHVMPGTYDEKVSVYQSGLAGTNITFKGEGYPIIRGFDFTGQSNWAVIGFHFYHPSTNYSLNAISINRAMNFSILDNIFDSIHALSAVIAVGTYSTNNWASHGLIRSNYFYRAGLCTGSTVPAVNIILAGTNNLVEYNEVSQSDDFTRIWGERNIVRNNYYHDTSYSLFSTQPHTDGMQNWDQPGLYPSVDHNLWERNLVISNCNANGHIIIMQNQQSNAAVFMITDFTARENVALYTGGGFAVIDDVPNVRIYNNTVAWVRVGDQIGAGTNQNNFCVEVSTNYQHTGTILPTNIVVINNIFDTACVPGYGTVMGSSVNMPIVAGPPFYPVVANNLTYCSGPSIPSSMGGDIIINNAAFSTNGHYYTNAQFISRAIPSFDMHLTNASLGQTRARPQTTTTASGTMTNVVPVADAGFYTDGWGIAGVDGDVVEIGANAGTMITSIDYTQNTLTLAANISWNAGDGVFLDGTQDIGAYRYDPVGYNYGISLTTPLPRTLISGLTTLTATVTNPAKVRIVRFYVDGIEVGHASPGPTVSITAPITGTNNVVQARAYALHAEKVLAMASSVVVNEPPVPVVTGVHVVSPSGQ